MTYKRILAICGAVGLAGCFLPLTTHHGLSISFFSLRHFARALPVYAVVLGFLIPILAATLETRPRVVAIASTAGFGYVGWKFGLDLPQLAFTGIGGLCMSLACVAGLAVSVLALLAGGNEKRVEGFGL